MRRCQASGAYAQTLPVAFMAQAGVQNATEVSLGVVPGTRYLCISGPSNPVQLQLLAFPGMGASYKVLASAKYNGILNPASTGGMSC
jgi:hypothetical protein